MAKQPRLFRKTAVTHGVIGQAFARFWDAYPDRPNNPKPAHPPAPRPCMRCSKTLLSHGPSNRLCRACNAYAAKCVPEGGYSVCLPLWT